MKLLAIFAFAASATAIPLSIPECGIGYQADAQRSCCKVCKKGKACGDSCIARDKQCQKPTGCACNV